VSNIVHVTKKQGTISICIIFRYLYNSCPKENFPTPFLNPVIDACDVNEALPFMDGYYMPGIPG
jgi:hypothetical protein